MRGFLLGLVVAGLAFAGYVVWNRQHAPQPSISARGGRADAGVATKKKKKRVRGAARVARVATNSGGRSPQPQQPEPEPEPEPIKLSASDLKLVAQGDDLSRPDVLKMDLGDGKETRELTQDDIDGRFRANEGAILDCISSARPDPETYVPGRVTVKFRIQRTGAVRGVRVEAPSILQKGGLFGCVKKVVGNLHFPASGGSQIVSYPFTLS